MYRTICVVSFNLILFLIMWLCVYVFYFMILCNLKFNSFFLCFYVFGRATFYFCHSLPHLLHIPHFLYHCSSFLVVSKNGFFLDKFLIRVYAFVYLFMRHFLTQTHAIYHRPFRCCFVKFPTP